VLFAAPEKQLMSDDELREQTNQRWRETLALLGLPPEPETGHGLTVPASQPVVDYPVPEPEPLPHARAPESAAPHEPDFDDRVDAYATMEPAEVTPQPPPSPTATIPGGEQRDEPSTPSGRESDDEAIGRGRRRGRRGGRGRSRRAAEAARPDESEPAPELAESPNSAETASATETREERSRRGGRGRSKKPADKEFEPAVTAEEEDDLEEELAAEEAPEEDHDDEPDTLSDWNVPSWQELISSLYRPDR
jgi:hypothetical protein